MTSQPVDMPTAEITRPPSRDDVKRETRSRDVNRKEKDGTDRIAGSNWCTMFLYNIPRASMMITLPGVAIVVTGAAMVAFADRTQPWTDGLSLIALICIVVGGVMTVGGLVYWFAAWWRYKPPMAHKVKRNSVAPPGELDGVHMEAVYTYPVEPTVDTRTNGAIVASSNTDTALAHQETVFTVQ